MAHGLGRLPYERQPEDYRLADHPLMAGPLEVPKRRLWTVNRVLDQGSTPHCVGFGWAGWGISLPVATPYTNGGAHKLYRECKAIDGEPDGENGSYVKSGAKAMKDRGRIASYYCSDPDDWEALRTFVLAVGPVVIGIGWTEDMYTPRKGVIRPTGASVGGHCLLMVGFDRRSGKARLHNSWGKAWGLDGQCEIAEKYIRAELADGGEAWAVVEAKS